MLVFPTTQLHYFGVPENQIALYYGVPKNLIVLYFGIPDNQVALYYGVPNNLIVLTLLNWDQTESVSGLADLDQPGHGSFPEGCHCICKVLNNSLMWV